MRALKELIDTSDTGLTLILEWLAGSRNGGQLLPRDTRTADATLARLQITTRSILGSVVYDTLALTASREFKAKSGPRIQSRRLHDQLTALGADVELWAGT